MSNLSLRFATVLLLYLDETVQDVIILTLPLKRNILNQQVQMDVTLKNNFLFSCCHRLCDECCSKEAPNCDVD